MTTNDNTSPRAGLDLDAIEARIAACARLCAWEEGDGCREVATQRCAGGNCGLRLCEAHAEAHSNEAAHDTYPLPRNAVPEARALLAEVRRLRALRDDIADAFDGLVMKVWRAAGEEHEPPADVAALTDRVDALRCEVESYARRLAGRDETNANLLGRLIAAENTVTAARREGAEAMREACAKAIDARASQSETTRERYSSEDDRYGEALAVSCACEDLASALRALPLPGGES